MLVKFELVNWILYQYFCVFVCFAFHFLIKFPSKKLQFYLIWKHDEKKYSTFHVDERIRFSVHT